MRVTTTNEQAQATKKQNPWSDMQASVPDFIKNKYFLAVLIFAFLFVFVGANCLIAQLKMNVEIKKLERKKASYEEEIVELKNYLQELQTNTVVQEKIARERYFVKKPNEEVFLMNDISER